MFLGVIGNRILRTATAIHALTDLERKDVPALGLATPTFVVPNGVSPVSQDDAPDPGAFLARHPQLAGKLAGRRALLFLGRLHAVKNLDVLAESFIEVAARFPDTVLLVAGPDEDGSGRRAAGILERAGLGRRAVFTGMLTGEDKRAALACAELFVLPSQCEGFSHAVLEGLAAGLPVVISKQCNFPEVAAHGAGFVVEADAAAVAGAAGTLLADDGLRSRCARNGRELVRERYAWPRIARTVADFYRHLVDQRGRLGSGEIRLPPAGSCDG